MEHDDTTTGATETKQKNIRLTETKIKCSFQMEAQKSSINSYVLSLFLSLIRNVFYMDRAWLQQYMDHYSI